MATIKKHGKGWQARIRKTGYPQQTKSFRTKREAEQWSRQVETDLDRGVVRDRRTVIGKTLHNLLSIYHDRHAVPERKGHQHAALVRQWMAHPIAARTLESLGTADFVDLREERLAAGLKSKTVREDLLMFKRAYDLGRTEYGFVGMGNPLGDVKLPSAGQGRDRRLQGDEEARILAAARDSGSPWLLAYVELAIGTTMRRSEMLSARWVDFDPRAQILRLRDTKNGTDRDVPLTCRCVEIIKALPRTGPRLFELERDSVTQAFSRLLHRLGVEDLRLHDLRHEGVSRYADRGDLTIVDLASISGHKSYQSLRRYTHPCASKLAKRLG